MVDSGGGERGFEVDLATLDAGVTELSGLLERARAIAAELDDALAATGQAWGTDAVGSSFAAAHESAATETHERVRGLGAALEQAGAGFAAAAQAYRQVDGEADSTLSAAMGLDPR